MNFAVHTSSLSTGTTGRAVVSVAPAFLLTITPLLTLGGLPLPPAGVTAG